MMVCFLEEKLSFIDAFIYAELRSSPCTWSDFLSIIKVTVSKIGLIKICPEDFNVTLISLFLFPVQCQNSPSDLRYGI